MVAIESTTQHAVQPRRMRFDFSKVSKHWFHGSVWATHMANSLNLLFPTGERFFIRSVRHFADRLSDPKLREQVRGFIAQEALHGSAHEAFFEQMDAHGWTFRPLLGKMEKLAWEMIEPRLSPEVRLAVTVSLEHYTAVFAHKALTEGVISSLESPMRDLLLWHAAEEIEHKSVAFDVLKAVDPSYATRITGHVLGTVGLLAFWWIGAIALLLQDPEAKPQRLRQERQRAHEMKQIDAKAIAKSFFDYFRRDYHPWQVNDYDLAAAQLARATAAATG